MATVTKTRRGFRVDCIHCGERGTVSVDLGNMSEFKCSSCDGTWTADDVRKLIAEWSAVLAWTETAPVLD